MAGIKETILLKSEDIRDEVVRLRRHFHKHPELSYKEIKTALYISDWLTQNKIPFRGGIAGTGIIATIDGKGRGSKIVAVRAEMDALPVQERNTSDYASTNPGIMHACGHDAHMAMMMGSALIMKELVSYFGGKILLIFQPGEEKSPGGAKLMIDSGELNNPKPDIILAQHNLPELETGKTGFRAGRYMASCDEIYITVAGTGGHAALPGLTTDQIFIASLLVVRLKTGMAERQKVKNIPTVLGIGKISGEGATNVIPEKVEIAGTFRTFDEKWRYEGIELIRKIAEDTASEYKVKILVNIAEGYPVLVNDERLTESALSFSADLLGKEKTECFDIRMSSDDFSFYSALAPSLYFRIGLRQAGSEPKKLHTPDFDIDESGMTTGVANLSWLVYNFLSEE